MSKGTRRCFHSIQVVQFLFYINVLLQSVLIQSPACHAFHSASTLQSSTDGRNGFQIVRKDHRNYRNSALCMQEWEGDDLRWSTRIRRRLQRRSTNGDDTPVKTTLLSLNALLFLYHIVTTVDSIRRIHPDFWPSHAMTIVSDTVIGSSVPGPLIRDFGFLSSLAQNQPHRYLTSGFFHSGILHLLINVDTWRRQPSWLESGLGAPLYITTFLVSIVGGNLGHASGLNQILDQTMCLGPSAGISGLYGLMYTSLIRMGNRDATRRIARGMATMIIASLFLENVSFTSHVTGFLVGVAMAVLFSPGYKKDYSMRRKNSAEYDSAPRDFRQAMGFGIVPTDRGVLPISLLWVGLAVLYLFSQPKFHTIPALIVKGLLVPGSLTS